MVNLAVARNRVPRVADAPYLAVVVFQAGVMVSVRVHVFEVGKREIVTAEVSSHFGVAGCLK